MKRRLVGMCVAAYPRAVRERDGELLRDLAVELGDERGFGREALSLLRGGLVERVRTGTARRRAVALAFAVVLLLVVVVPLGVGQRHVEHDQFECVGSACTEVRALVAERQRDGWDCTPTTEPTSEVARWRCIST